ncbi:MAG: CoA-binding protein [Paracoccaceae bacterium]
MTDAELTALLTRVRRIALVGFSANPARPSHRVAAFLIRHGYAVVPVNPGLAGQTHLGVEVTGALSGIEGPVDMVDVFRASEHVAGIVDEVLTLWPDAPPVIWTQLDVRDDAAAARARAAGATVVQDRCPAIEIPRLGVPRPA